MTKIHALFFPSSNFVDFQLQNTIDISCFSSLKFLHDENNSNLKVAKVGLHHLNIVIISTDI